MSRHTVGIDLGTTNCALAFRDLSAGSGDIVSVPQLTAPGVVEERLLLPSFLYVAKEGEFPDGALAVPWHKKCRMQPGNSRGLMVQKRQLDSSHRRKVG